MRRTLTAVVFAGLTLAGFAGTATAASAATAPVTCSLSGYPGPVVTTAVFADVSVHCTAPVAVIVTGTLTDNMSHAKATATAYSPHGTFVATGTIRLPAIPGHSSGLLYRIQYNQGNGVNGPWTVKTGGIAGPKITGLSANGLSWNTVAAPAGLSWNKTTTVLNGLSWN